MKPLILYAHEVRTLLAGDVTIRRDHRGRGPLGGWPLGGPGARLWIRERYQLNHLDHGHRVVPDLVPEVDCGYWRPVYAAATEISHRWRAPVTMPQWASRCTAEVLRVEPVHEAPVGWRITLFGACPLCRWAGCSRMAHESRGRRGPVDPPEVVEARERACRVRGGGRP